MTTTTNGAPSLATTQDARLDLFFKTVRDISNANLVALIDASWVVDPLHTMKILMNWRDCRGGKGDYAGFVNAMVYVAEMWPEWFHVNIENVPEYGRYLDLVKIWHGAVSENTQVKIMDFIVTQLNTDKASIDSGTEVSLLAKWIPSEKKQWDKGFVKALCKALFKVPSMVTDDHMKALRKDYLVPLRKALKIVEHNLCDKDYASIKYEAVPSCAMQKYKKAFSKNDPEHFGEYMDEVKAGTKKINSTQVYPHDLVRKCMNSRGPDPVNEAQWEVLCKKVQASGAFDDSVVVCDVSGSMTGTPMEVAIALGLLSKQKLITFSENPQLHDVPYNSSLYVQVHNVMAMNWGYNTNFEKVMALVATLPQPIKRIYIFSDMQFDEAISGQGTMTHFEQIKAEWEERMPQIIFWNLKGNTKDFPTSSSDTGVTMLSGYSPALLSMIIDSKEMNPLQIMLSAINGERYQRVVAPQ